MECQVSPFFWRVFGTHGVARLSGNRLSCLRRGAEGSLFFRRRRTSINENDRDRCDVWKLIAIFFFESSLQVVLGFTTAGVVKVLMVSGIRYVCP